MSKTIHMVAGRHLPTEKTHFALEDAEAQARLLKYEGYEVTGIQTLYADECFITPDGILQHREDYTNA